LKITDFEKIWFTSDIHFGHKAILDFCPNRIKKYGVTVNEMNKNIIADWNESVSQNDIVFVLGDVSFASVNQTAEYLSQLNGNIHLVYGNHCRKFLDKKLFTVWFKSIQPYLDLQIGQQKIVLCHYPIYEWDSCHWGAWHLHGHPTKQKAEEIRDEFFIQRKKKLKIQRVDGFWFMCKNIISNLKFRRKKDV
jgi:calcineurin-like phosphoesterase family protein